ncbi:MAG: gliding motility-associated protein GldE [Bacteroidales bacterium]|nr:gliding motility-associated protein GldE [Bacteroidales bacterium]
MIKLESAFALEIVAAHTGLKLIIGFTILILLLFLTVLLSTAGRGYSLLSPEGIERLRTSSRKNSRIMLRLCNYPERIPGTICIASGLLNMIIAMIAFRTSTMIISISSCTFAGCLLIGIIILLPILFFSYVIPQLFSPEMSISTAVFMAWPIFFLDKLLRPLSSARIFSAPELKKWPGTFRTGRSFDEISDGYEQAADSLNEDDKILEGIVNFGNINVSTIMCPRIDVTAIDIRSAFSQIIQVIISTGFSRIPVYSETFDNVKGILYAKDILPYMSNPGDFKWQSLLREPYFVPEAKRINDLLKEFQIKKIHMAVVIDEYGGTSGIVTLEDILEEIVGEIIDESDEDEIPYRKIDEKTYVFEGRILLNEMIKILELNTDPFTDARGEAETLAGLILEITGEIPEQGQIIRFRNFEFRIESADKRRIKEIRAEIITENEKAEEK